MNSLPDPITKKTFEGIVFQWIDVIKRNESLSIINLSNREQPWRVNQLLQDKILLKKFPEHYQILVIDLSSLAIEEEEEFDLYLSKLRNSENNKIILFILQADRLLVEKKTLLSYLNSLPRRNPTYSVLFFFQKNILFPSYYNTFSSFPTLYQNICLYPYYKKEDCLQFISYLQKKFKVKIPKKIQDLIISECGGNLWLIKEAVRYYAKNPNLSNMLSHDEMMLRLQIVYEEMSTDEKNVLEKLVRKNYIFTRDEKAVIEYFLKTDFISKNENNYSFNGLLLERYIKMKLTQKNVIRLNELQQIIIDGIRAESIFSPRERCLLKHMIKNPGKIITRDKVASFVYQDDYSDWALDQFIRRLRNKFFKLGLSCSLIKTIKNQGYLFNNHH